MLNGIFPFVNQAGSVQSSVDGIENPIVPAFQASTGWIEDEIRLWALDY